MVFSGKGILPLFDSLYSILNITIAFSKDLTENEKGKSIFIFCINSLWFPKKSKNDLNSRLNYANLLCSSDVQDPSQCRIRKCEVWKNSGWSSCGSVSVRDGGREVLQKDRRESYAQTKINNEARENKFPKMIFVEGDFGDAWKTSNLGGLFKQVEGKATANMDGRPVFQKADKSDFYIAYYAPR